MYELNCLDIHFLLHPVGTNKQKDTFKVHDPWSLESASPEDSPPGSLEIPALFQAYRAIKLKHVQRIMGVL